MKDKQIELRDKLFEQAIIKSRTNFLTFVKLMVPHLIADFKMGNHIELLANKLQQVQENKLKRLMVFLPPRSSKSVICSKLFPAWYMGNHANHEILSVSHSDQLASDFGRAVRDIDVMSEEDAFSEAGRRYIKEWYPAGLRTRLMPNGSVVIINTRYHEDDICGWLLETQRERQKETIFKDKDEDNIEIDEWEVIKIPAWLDDDSAEILKLPVGSSYFPEWKPNELLKKDEIEIRSQNGSKYWQSLYMQDPTPEEGGILKKDWFKIWEYSDDPPDCDFIIQTCDTAFSAKTTADYSVIQTWGIFTRVMTDSYGTETMVANLILLSNMRERLEYPELRSTAQQMYDSYEPDVIIIEKKASGQSLIQDLRRAGLPILEYNPDRDKVTRANASTPILEAGRVWLPNKPFAQDLINEAAAFPHATYDDQVDAMVMAILYMKDSWKIDHPLDAFQIHEVEDNYHKPKRVGYWRI